MFYYTLSKYLTATVGRNKQYTMEYINVTMLRLFNVQGRTGPHTTIYKGNVTRMYYWAMHLEGAVDLLVRGLSMPWVEGGQGRSDQQSTLPPPVGESTYPQ